jgi:hypothetical protein
LALGGTGRTGVGAGRGGGHRKGHNCPLAADTIARSDAEKTTAATIGFIGEGVDGKQRIACDSELVIDLRLLET